MICPTSCGQQAESGQGQGKRGAQGTQFKETLTLRVDPALHNPESEGPGDLRVLTLGDERGCRTLSLGEFLGAGLGQGRPALRRAAESLGRPRPPASAASHAPLLLRELTGLWVSTPLRAPGSCRRPTRRGQCLCRSRHCPFAMASNAWQRGSQCSNGHAKPDTPGRRIDPPLSRAGSGVSQGSESLARPPGHGRGRPGCH